MATANPYFEVQHQAISSLRQVQRICLTLQAAQAAASILVLIFGYRAAHDTFSVSRILHLYSATFYAFVALFAHVVVYYVLAAMGRNVRTAHTNNPKSVDTWLVGATASLKLKLLPFYALHVAALTYSVSTASMYSTTVNPRHGIGAICAVITGLIAFSGSWLALRRNATYLESFVTTGGFAELPQKNI